MAADFREVDTELEVLIKKYNIVEGPAPQQRQQQQHQQQQQQQQNEKTQEPKSGGVLV
jgi:hypothetical protein